MMQSNLSNMKNRESLSKPGNNGQNAQEDQLGQYIFEQQKKNQERPSHSSSEIAMNSSSISEQKPQDMDSDEWEMKNQYDNYGMQQNLKNKKIKQDKKIKKLKNYASDDNDDDNNDDKKIIKKTESNVKRKAEIHEQNEQMNQSQGQLYNQQLKQLQRQLRQSQQKKENRSSSLSLRVVTQDPQELDGMQNQLLSLDKSKNSSMKRHRNNSIQVNDSKEQELIQHQYANASEGRQNVRFDGQQIKDSRFDLIDNQEEDLHDIDLLQLHIEDQRLKLLDEIQQLVQKHKRPGVSESSGGSNRPDNDQANLYQSSLNTKQRTRNQQAICDYLQKLNIDVEPHTIQDLSTKERKILQELTGKYEKVVNNQCNYINVENIDNESHVDEDDNYGVEFDEEEGEDEQEEEQDIDQYGDVEDEQDHIKPSNVVSQTRGGQSASQLSNMEEMKRSNSDNHVSSDSNHSNQKENVPQAYESAGRKPVKKAASSDLVQMPVVSDAALQESDLDLPHSPSLAEIDQTPSQRSIDSNKIKLGAVKYDPRNARKNSMNSLQSLKSNKSRKFIHDLVSEQSVLSRKQSQYRAEKLHGLEADYHIYLQMNQGIFIIRCQMMNIELQKIRKTCDIDQMMVEFHNFKKLQKEIQQDEVYRGLQTIIIDIENTLVVQLEIKSKIELDLLKESENFNSDYIIIKKSLSKHSRREKKNGDKNDNQNPQQMNDKCCEFSGTEECICDLLVYQVRPYTYEILRAIQPFFEIVVFSKMHYKILEHIIDHIEAILNKPIKDFLEKFKNNKNKSSTFQRMKKLPDIKIYFQFIIHQRQYIHLKDHDKWVENLMVLTKNRLKENLIFISSNPFRIVSAIKSGFLTVPVIQFESFYRDDFQLSLVEHYILKIRHLKDMKKRLKRDFKFLVQRIEKQPPMSPPKNSVNKKSEEIGSLKALSNKQEDQKSFRFEIGSAGSFGINKIKKGIKNEQTNVNQNLKIRKKAAGSKYSSFRPRNCSIGKVSFGSDEDLLDDEHDLEEEEDDEEGGGESPRRKDSPRQPLTISNLEVKQQPTSKFIKYKFNQIIEEDEKSDNERQGGAKDVSGGSGGSYFLKCGSNQEESQNQHISPQNNMEIQNNAQFKITSNNDCDKKQSALDMVHLQQNNSCESFGARAAEQNMDTELSEYNQSQRGHRVKTGSFDPHDLEKENESQPFSDINQNSKNCISENTETQNDSKKRISENTETQNDINQDKIQSKVSIMSHSQQSVSNSSSLRQLSGSKSNKNDGSGGGASSVSQCSESSNELSSIQESSKLNQIVSSIHGGVSKSHTSNSSSLNQDQLQYHNGKVIYDAGGVILEESQSQLENDLSDAGIPNNESSMQLGSIYNSKRVGDRPSGVSLDFSGNILDIENELDKNGNNRGQKNQSNKEVAILNLNGQENDIKVKRNMSSAEVSSDVQQENFNLNERNQKSSSEIQSDE